MPKSVLLFAFKKNCFIQASFKPSSNIVDTRVQEIIADLPEGFELISYLADYNLGIKGKQAEVSITYNVSSISRPSYIDHRVPSIANVGISRSYGCSGIVNTDQVQTSPDIQRLVQIAGSMAH